MVKNRKTVHWHRLLDQEELEQEIEKGVEFALLSENYHQCSPFVMCKDFLQDAIHGRVNKTSLEIYGFEYNSRAKHQPCTDKLRLVVANSSDKNFRFKIANCEEFLNKIETKLGISPKTTFREAKTVPALKYSRGGAWMISGSQRWINSPVMLSLYTLLVRIGFKHEKGDSFRTTIDQILNKEKTAYQEVDRGRLEEAMPGIERILKDGDQNIFYKAMKRNYPSAIATEDMHEVFGIIGFAEQECREFVPAWFKGVPQEEDDDCDDNW